MSIDYDRVYRTSVEYRRPYRESYYYPLWQQALALLPPDRGVRILEIGCGSGQFGAMLRDAGYRCYTGIDVSAEAIRLAAGLGLNAARAEAHRYLAKHPDEYDVLIALEVFEHLIDDRQLLRVVRPGTAVVFSVPNFPDAAHRRYFATANKVRQHYGDLLSIAHLTRALEDRGRRWYVGSGTRRPLRIVAIMPAYNELAYLPLKLAWCRRHGLTPYVVDNDSTDGTYAYLCKHDVACHRVDTGGAFDILALQAGMPEALRRIKADWAIYQGVDLFFETDEPLAMAVFHADVAGYNLIRMRVVGLYNTGEPRGRFDPFHTYYRCVKGTQVALIHKVAGLLRYNGDRIEMESPREKRLPGAIVNMGFTKPPAEREETYRRRMLAWQRGLRPGVGRHYEPMRALEWVRPRERTVDIRATGWWRYYQRLQDLGR